ncbi:hypothetical protein BRADI_1g41695v3 [Brachypodium distachyon]|uniref:Uncharacterized protein n=1 Tax=Brachypodium distachyon TaxID=15368 RepID=A0A2K2DNQ5_BRADI|nr:hypothetical protein BRADI_1g41695v3 [Brachypodium distachyon]
MSSQELFLLSASSSSSVNGRSPAHSEVISSSLNSEDEAGYNGDLEEVNGATDDEIEFQPDLDEESNFEHEFQVDLVHPVDAPYFVDLQEEVAENEM